MCAMTRPSAARTRLRRLFRYSRDRSGDHPVEHLRPFTGILQADAYAGYRRLYEHWPIAGTRDRGALLELTAGASSTSSPTLRRTRGAESSAPPISPLALEAVKRIDALFDIERAINGAPAGAASWRCASERSAPLVAELEDWMRMERAGLSRHAAAGQGHGLYAEALGQLRALPRRRPHLP